MPRDDRSYLTIELVNRYARQIILPDIGREGQEGQKKLKASHVLLAGIAGLGSLSSLYLCTAGIGHLTIVDSGVFNPQT